MTAPLKLVVVLELMVATPLLPEATVMGLGQVPLKLPPRVVVAEPLLSPRVMMLVLTPKTAPLLGTVIVPFLMVVLPVKVLATAPASLRLEVLLFWTMPVTLLPIAALNCT